MLFCDNDGSSWPIRNFMSLKYHTSEMSSVPAPLLSELLIRLTSSLKLVRNELIFLTNALILQEAVRIVHFLSLCFYSLYFSHSTKLVNYDTSRYTQ